MSRPYWNSRHGTALRDVFAALDAAGMSWMVLRNYQGLPDDNSSKDIDVGLCPSDFLQAEALIADTLKKVGLGKQQTAVFQWGRCSSYFGIVDGTPMSIKIDLMDGYSWRVAGLFDFTKMQRNIRVVDGIPIPGEVDDALVAWLKPLMTGGMVKAAYVPLITAVVKDHPTEVKTELARLFRPDLATAVWNHLSVGRYEALIPMRSALSWNAWGREVRRAPSQFLWQALRYVGLEIRRRSRRPTGSFLAVLGPDGAGKTTFLDVFSHDLAVLQSKDIAGIQVRHFRPRIFPNLISLLTRTPEAPAGQAQVPHKAPLAKPLSSFLRMVYYWSDYVWGYWRQIRMRSVAGRTTVFDRYIQDFLVDPRRTRIGLPRAVTRGFIRATPQPDLIFILRAPPKAIYARKQELEPDEIARQLAEYQLLRDSDPERYITLDATLTPENVSRDALRALVARLSDREIL